MVGGVGGTVHDGWVRGKEEEKVGRKVGGRVSGRHKLHDLVTDLAPDHDRAQRYSLLQALLHGYPHNLVTLSLPAWLPT